MLRRGYFLQNSLMMSECVTTITEFRPPLLADAGLWYRNVARNEHNRVSTCFASST